MLAAHEAYHIGRWDVVLGARTGQAGQCCQERYPTLDAELLGRHDAGGIVQTAERERDAVAVNVAKEQRVPQSRQKPRSAASELLNTPGVPKVQAKSPSGRPAS